MSTEKNLLLTKISKTQYWKNNYIQNYKYSNIFFQLNLLKSIIYYFFFNSISNKLLNKKYDIKNLYISQIWINSINNTLIVSFSIYLQENIIKEMYEYENYLRLKYFYNILHKSTIV